MSIPLRALIKSLHYSRLAYFNHLENSNKIVHDFAITKFLCGRPKGQDSQAYIFLPTYGKTAYVAFRGTESVSDVVTDMNALDWKRACFGLDTSTKCVKLHLGFYDQYLAVHELLRQQLYEIDPNLYDEIVFTGHSLGGALAQIAAVNLASSPHPSSEKTIKVHTFGSPRIGANDFNELYNTIFATSLENHWRVYNLHDPVQRIPLQTKFIDSEAYQHVDGNTLCLFGDQRITTNDFNIYTDMDINSPLSYVVENKDSNLSPHITSLLHDSADHQTDVYMERLLKLESEERAKVTNDFLVI